MQSSGVSPVCCASWLASDAWQHARSHRLEEQVRKQLGETTRDDMDRDEEGMEHGGCFGTDLLDRPKNYQNI
jgi:hypothetical protein